MQRHHLSVTLTNPDGLRLTISVPFTERNTPTENYGRNYAQQQANEDENHAKHGPWTAQTSRWEN